MSDRTTTHIPQGSTLAATLLGTLLVAFLSACSGSASDSSTSNSLQLVSTSGMFAEGMRGEALPAASHGFVIRNVGERALDWAIGADKSWLRVPEQAGTLAARTELYVPVQLIESEVLALDPALHRGMINLRQNGNTSVELEVGFELIILPRPALIADVVAPLFLPVGTEDGQFTPNQTNWQFKNKGDMALAWEFEASEEWVDIDGALSGLLAPDEMLNLTLRIDEWQASSIGAGSHTAHVRLVNKVTGRVAEEQTIVLSVMQGINIVQGWSVLRGSVGSRVIFVSDRRGNDANDGLSPQTAKKTIAAGKALMRHGEPDYLLLRRGDVFQEGLGQWKTAGRSLAEPQVVSTYGRRTVRPTLLTGASGGLVTHGGGGSPAHIDNVAFVGLHFLADTHTGTGQPVGIALHQPSSNILIEDCMVERYNTGIVIQAIGGRHSNVRIRRSLVLDSFAVNDGNPQGLYCVNTDDFLIENSVFDTNGWQPNVPGATADIFSHNIYVDTDNSGVVIRGNVIANGASHGVQMRSGGTCHNNLFVRNSIGLMMAGGSGPQQNTSHATLNVITDGKDIDVANPRGWGIDFNDVVGGDIRRNLIMNNANGHLPIPVLLDGGGFGNGVHNVEMLNNVIYNWGGSAWFTGESNELTGIRFENNVIQNMVDASSLVDHFTLSNHASFTSAGNRFYSAAASASRWMHQPGNFQSVPQWKQDLGDSSSASVSVPYSDPGRQLADYSATLGHAATHEAFMAEVRLQARYNWRREYTAYRINHWFREGL